MTSYRGLLLERGLKVNRSLREISRFSKGFEELKQSLFHDENLRKATKKTQALRELFDFLQESRIRGRLNGRYKVVFMVFHDSYLAKAAFVNALLAQPSRAQEILPSATPFTNSTHSARSIHIISSTRFSVEVSTLCEDACDNFILSSPPTLLIDSENKLPLEEELMWSSAQQRHECVHISLESDLLRQMNAAIFVMGTDEEQWREDWFYLCREYGDVVPICVYAHRGHTEGLVDAMSFVKENMLCSFQFYITSLSPTPPCPFGSTHNFMSSSTGVSSPISRYPPSSSTLTASQTDTGHPVYPLTTVQQAAHFVPSRTVTPSSLTSTNSAMWASGAASIEPVVVNSTLVYPDESPATYRPLRPAVNTPQQYEESNQQQSSQNFLPVVNSFPALLRSFNAPYEHFSHMGTLVAVYGPESLPASSTMLTSGDLLHTANDYASSSCSQSSAGSTNDLRYWDVYPMSAVLCDTTTKEEVLYKTLERYFAHFLRAAVHCYTRELLRALSEVMTRCSHLVCDFKYSMDFSQTKLDYLITSEQQLFTKMLAIGEERKTELVGRITQLLAEYRTRSEETLLNDFPWNEVGLSSPNHSIPPWNLRKVRAQLERHVERKLDTAICAILVEYVDHLKRTHAGVLSRLMEKLVGANNKKVMTEKLWEAYNVNVSGAFSMSLVNQILDDMRLYWDKSKSTSTSTSSSSSTSTSSSTGQSRPQTQPGPSSQPQSPNPQETTGKEFALRVLQRMHADKLSEAANKQIKQNLHRAHADFVQETARMRNLVRFNCQQYQTCSVRLREVHLLDLGYLYLEVSSLRDACLNGVLIPRRTLGRGQFGIVSTCDNWGAYNKLCIKQMMTPYLRLVKEYGLQYFHIQSIGFHERIVNTIGVLKTERTPANQSNGAAGGVATAGGVAGAAGGLLNPALIGGVTAPTATQHPDLALVAGGGGGVALLMLAGNVLQHQTMTGPLHSELANRRAALNNNNNNNTSGTAGRVFGVCFIMECMERDVYCALKEKRLTLRERFQVAHDVVEGIRYLHSRGYIHRDIKSKNVMLDAANRAKLADLDFCKPSYLLDSSIVGTPLHMAPEQFHGHYNPSVDVYAFGILLWNLWANSEKMPHCFRGIRAKDVLRERVQKGERPARPAYLNESKRRTSVPKLSHMIDLKTWQLMEACWCGDPKERLYPGNILVRLEEILDLVGNGRDCKEEGRPASSSAPCCPTPAVLKGAPIQQC